MAFVTIPLLSDTPHWEQTTTLDGTDYLLRFRYSQREQTYYVSLYLGNGTEIIKGQRMICNWPLFADCVDPNMPPGTFVLIPSDPTDESPPKLGDLGDNRRCTLVYDAANEGT
jgi:hypothetical protein